MNRKFGSIATLPALLLADLALAHSGHGEPGSFGHAMQHQLWMFAALVVVSAALLLNERRGRNRE